MDADCPCRLFSFIVATSLKKNAPHICSFKSHFEQWEILDANKWQHNVSEQTFYVISAIQSQYCFHGKRRKLRWSVCSKSLKKPFTIKFLENFFHYIIEDRSRPFCNNFFGKWSYIFFMKTHMQGGHFTTFTKKL